MYLKIIEKGNNGKPFTKEEAQQLTKDFCNCEEHLRTLVGLQKTKYQDMNQEIFNKFKISILNGEWHVFSFNILKADCFSSI